MTFRVQNVHPHDVSAILAENDIAVRAGHHCAEPLHRFIGIPSTTRASLMFYNTEEEIESLEEASALRDISHMPARVKCAVLGWHTFGEMTKK